MEKTAERENYLFQYAKEISVDTKEIPLEDGWRILYENGICVLVETLRREKSTSIINKPFGVKGYVSLYTISYSMCSNVGPCDHSKHLYSRSKEAIETVLEQVFAELRMQSCSIQEEDLLKRFSDNWSNHKVMVKWMQQLFRHLDNGYVANTSMPTLTSVGLRAFYDYAFVPLNFHVRDALLSIINKNRDGDQDVDLSLIRCCVDIFHIMGLSLSTKKLQSLQEALSMEPNLDLYVREFETHFLATTTSYYQKKSQLWLQNESASTYLHRVQSVLEQERSRALHCLHASTLPKLLLVCQQQLLEKHKHFLVHQEKGGMLLLLTNERQTDLKLLFTMLRQVPQGLTPMATIFQKYILNCGNTILKSFKEQQSAHTGTTTNPSSTNKHHDNSAMIERLLSLHKNALNIIRQVFENENQFQQALRSAFQDIINTTSDDGQVPTVEILVMYLDKVLNGKIRLSEEALELKLDELLQLFLLVADKDLYAEIYREKLAKRLLNKKFVSLHAEKSMIIKMKTQQGAPFTTKLEGMLNDFAIAQDFGRDWSAGRGVVLSNRDQTTEKKTSILSTKLDFTVQVLTQGFWPAQKFRDLNLTRELKNAKTDFDDWYKEKHSHRVLTWIYALGEATVRATFDTTRKYDISLSTFQAVTLLLFNSAHVLSFSIICDNLGVDITTGKRILHSLACGKHKVLLKTGQPKSINPGTDEFRINTEFSSKLKRFSIPISTLDTESRKNINVEVQQQRGFNIDAALVRIMKARKRLSHQELIGEVIHQIQTFTPEIKLLRQRIEGLIEREYIQREDADPRSYVYLP